MHGAMSLKLSIGFYYEQQLWFIGWGMTRYRFVRIYQRFELPAGYIISLLRICLKLT